MSEAKRSKRDSSDRISELPTDLLVRILRFLPTKEAVTTMFLSKRWFLIWTMLRRLEYKDNEDETDENKKSIWWFLDESLQFHKKHLHHKIHVIDTLHIELRSQCPTDADVGKWIAYAVDRRVRCLKFELLWSTDSISLPKSLYSCETLKSLTLSHKILVDFPSSSCLPSLQVLNLSSVVYKDESSQARFLSCCPILRWLFVERKENDNVSRFSVKVPSLFSLEYYNYDESDEEDAVKCLVIDTPALRALIITDYSGDSCLVENMPPLFRAEINVKSFPGSDKFIRSLSSVWCLELDFTDEVVIRCSTIKLPQLRKLRIYPNESDWLEPLMVLLGNAPKLTHLRVESSTNVFRPEDLPLSWNQPSYVPTCLSSQLEIFQWIEYWNSKEEKEFLRYVFGNSKCLKTPKISLSSSFNSLEEHNLVVEELKDIPRVSTQSELILI